MKLNLLRNCRLAGPRKCIELSDERTKWKHFRGGSTAAQQLNQSNQFNKWSLLIDDWWVCCSCCCCCGLTALNLINQLSFQKWKSWFDGLARSPTAPSSFTHQIIPQFDSFCLRAGPPTPSATNFLHSAHSKELKWKESLVCWMASGKAICFFNQSKIKILNWFHNQIPLITVIIQFYSFSSFHSTME